MTTTAPGMDTAAEALAAAVERVVASQREAIARAAALVAQAIPAGGIVQVFGTGHSRAFGMEVAGRAGGLIPANRLAIGNLVMLGGEPPSVVRDPHAERDPALAARVLALHDIRTEDVFVIASSSGGNGSVVELARLVKERGHRLVAVTSLEHTRRIESRHPSGKRLYELADVVIDNGAPYGDAVLDAPGGVRVCAVSSVTGAVIAQLLTVEVCRLLAEAGHELPVYVSANVPGGDAHNDRLRAAYGTRVQEAAD